MGNETEPKERGAEAVEEALEAFRDLLTPDEVEQSRELLLDVLAAHPVGRLLAERVRDRRRVLNSNEHPTLRFGSTPPTASTSEPPVAASDDLPSGDNLPRKGRATGGNR